MEVLVTVLVFSELVTLRSKVSFMWKICKTWETISNKFRDDAKWVKESEGPDWAMTYLFYHEAKASYLFYELFYHVRELL